MKKFRNIFAVALFTFQALYAQTYMGNFTSYEPHNDYILVRSGESLLKIIPYAHNILRIDFLPNIKSTIDSSFSVTMLPMQKFDYKINETDSLLIIKFEELEIECRKYPISFAFSNTHGNHLLNGLQFSQHNQKRRVTFNMNYTNHFYGTGERGTDLDKRGQIFECYNTQIGGYDTALSTMNVNIPFFCTNNGYAIYIDNIYKSTFDFGSTDSTRFSYTTTGGEISMYFMSDSTFPGQLDKYTRLTGRQPLPPRWAFGFMQSKNRYANESELRAIVDTIRQKEIPCDAVIIDLAWFKHMGDIAWDKSAWQNHAQMVSDFLKRGIKTILITEPYIVESSSNFNTAYENNYLVKDSSGKPYLLENWWSCRGCNAALLDITNPEAAKWWWNLHPEPFRNIAGIWTDLGEPERHPEEMIHYLGSAKKIHNIYNLLWAKLIFEGFNKLHPNKRVLNLTRSGFAGIQRYGALPWSGDVARNFNGLAVQLPMLLNMGMSGLAYQNSDIGGYSRIPGSPELYARWMAFGIFCGITRVHGAGEIVKGYPTEPWRYGPETERISKNFLKLRYSLLPYIYTLAHENYLSGLPIARPLFSLDANDDKLFNESSSFLFGDAFLVSPVVEPGVLTKKLYLPAGEWINYWTDEIYSGKKQVTITAPLDQVPLFVKKGSIIPMAPEMNFTNERMLDTLILRIYPSVESKSYTLFEDDGESLEYQQGAYSKVKILQSINDNNLRSSLIIKIDQTEGTFKGQLLERTYLLEVHLIERAPLTCLIDNKSIRKLINKNELRSNESGYFYNTDNKILYIQFRKKNHDSKSISIHLANR